MLLKNIEEYDHIYIACGYTDMRKGIDGLVQIIPACGYIAAAKRKKGRSCCTNTSRHAKAIVPRSF